MKKYLFIAASAFALASCSSEDFVGTEGGNVETSANKAINFSGNAGKITRATSNTGSAAQMLDYQFKVYGTKKMSENGTEIFPHVFSNYYVWYDAVKDNTTSKTNYWEYVGTKNATDLGTGKIKLDKDQTIKYWDYAASEYHFVAGSPIKNFYVQKFFPNVDISPATISGLAGHINANEEETALKAEPVYVATPVKVTKENYQKPVKFEFNRQQAMVRVGIYETIPGYNITEIKFYSYDTDGSLKVSDGNNIILTSATQDYFVGGKEITGTVKYDWDKLSYSFEYTDDTNLTKSQNWYAGRFEPVNELAQTSAETDVTKLYGKDKDMSDKGYFTVLPTPTATKASPILIKCDYTLTSLDTQEPIKVTGATAAIPAAYSKWDVNTRYTYLFKISDNTNGYTGDNSNKVGLFPITFDAAVKESTDAMQGTVTTVSTPSITTYQESSVTDASVEYKTGEAIYATATDDNGEEYTLTTGGTAVGNVQVYKLSKERNEAELQVSEVVKAEITNGIKITTTVQTTEITVGNIKLAANKYLSFTPTEAGFYAIQYLLQAAVGETPAVYAYKIIEVK